MKFLKKSHEIPTLAIVGGIILVALFISHQYFDNIEIENDDWAFSIYYMENVTSVESANLEFDFIKERLVFQSKFFVEGSGIKLDTGSRGFEWDPNCSRDLSLQLKDGTGEGLTWDNKNPVRFDDDWDVDYAIITRICEFDDDGSIPNGKFSLGVYGKDHISTIPVDNFHGEIIMDSTKYDCRDPCIFSQQFELTDSDNENNVRTVSIDMYDVKNYRAAFDLRTFNVANDYLSEILFSSVYVGLGVLITIIVFVISSQQQKEVSGILDKGQRKENRRIKYLFESLEKHLPDVISLAKERNKLVKDLTKDKSPATLIAADASVRWFDNHAKHLGFLLNGNIDVLEPVQIERFKTLVDAMHQIVFVHQNSNQSIIKIESLEKFVNSLEEVTTNVVDWKDLPT